MVSFQLLEQESIAHVTEESLVWKNFLSGDRKALAHIYSTYFDRLYNYGMKISPDAVLIEDSIQDMFIELLNRRERLNSEVKSIKYYLYKCLRRRILSKLTGKKHTVDIDELPAFEIKLCHKSHFLTHQIDSEVRQRIVKLIHTLSPKEKEAIFLIYFDELSYEEVASIMSLKIKTIYNLVHKAITKLRGRKKDFWQLTSLFSF